jgi:curved DNA-binding protein
MKYKDYYQIMGVSRNAPQDEIKRAYRKLARKYHPDVSKEPKAEERFKEVNEAYEVLGDSDKRRAYDQLGTGWRAGEDFTPPPGWRTRHDTHGGFSQVDVESFSDFFESIVGGLGHRHRPQKEHPRHTAAPPRGEEQHAEIAITLEESYHGTSKTIELEEYADGRRFGGTRKIKVNIPKGVSEGQQIRLAGQGQPGRGEGQRGDLFLKVHFQPHALYRAEGRDILLTLPIAPWEAALGTRVQVPTLGGPVEVNIPAGSQSGQKLRLKGRGLPGTLHGDQFIVLQVMIPQADTPAAKALYEQMRRELPFNPRAKWGL